MPQYQGSCHCGSISYSFEAPEITKGLRCNCSICQKKGAVMSDFVLAPDELHIEIKDDALATYQFGNQVARHQFCRKCGIYPFHTTFRVPNHYRINLGCVEGVNPLDLEIAVFDGASL